MLLSMTSYGRASHLINDKNVVVEIKTINSKYLDLRLRVPSNFNEKEMEVRKILSDHIHRGKVELNISYETDQGGEYLGINKALFKLYHKELEKLTNETGINQSDMLAAILRLPEVVGTSDEPLAEEQWTVVLETLHEALDKLRCHRVDEGTAMASDLTFRVNHILELLSEIEPLEKTRITMVKERMRNSLSEFKDRTNIDENRFEQEVLFYLEKIDINEEKVRLRQHGEYFLEILNSKKMIKGRKLTFISQELGREINTLGAKAYFSDIQKLVVEMKDDLEKIKEQLANTV